MSNFSFLQEPSAVTAEFALLGKIFKGGKAAGKTVGKGGFWEKAGPVMEAVGLATLPLSIAPTFIKSADTRALENIRDEDRIRAAKGLSALPMTNTIKDRISEIK